MQNHMSLVFFDLETAGLTSAHPDIQLAAIAVDPDWNELDTFDEKIRFDISRADPEALKLNHYDPAIWEREALGECAVVKSFAAFLGPYKCVQLVSKRTGNPYSVARLAGHH